MNTLLKNIIIAIKPKIYLNEYGIEIKSKTIFKFEIIPDSKPAVSDSLINNDTVGAIKDNPIASSNPETTNKKEEKITANLWSAKISFVNAIILFLFLVLSNLSNQT